MPSFRLFPCFRLFVTLNDEPVYLSDFALLLDVGECAVAWCYDAHSLSGACHQAFTGNFRELFIVALLREESSQYFLLSSAQSASGRIRASA